MDNSVQIRRNSQQRTMPVVQPQYLAGLNQTGPLNPVDRITLTTETSDIHNRTDEQVIEPLRRRTASSCNVVIVGLAAIIAISLDIFKIYRVSQKKHELTNEELYIAYGASILIGFLLGYAGSEIIRSLCGCYPCSFYSSLWFNVLVSLIYGFLIYIILALVSSALLGLSTFTLFP